MEIDYFIDQSTKEYKSIFDYLGSVNYTVAENIQYKDNSYYGFNIKLSEGSQKLDGEMAAKLMRYYMVQKRYDLVSEVMLTSLLQQINTENYDKKERIFSRLIDNSLTNLTIKDYNNADDELLVLSDETTGAAIYSVSPQYSGNKINAESLKEITGYFKK